MQKNRIGYTSVMFWSDFTSYADTSDCIVSFLLLPYTEAHVRYDLAAFSCMTRSRDSFMYNINLWATHTTILSTRGVQIPIDLVSSATDSIRQHVVLFKHVPIPTSDPKSEFLCQSSFSCAEPADPPEPPCTPGMSRFRLWRLPARSARGCKTFRHKREEYWRKEMPRKPKKTRGSVGW